MSTFVETGMILRREAPQPLEREACFSWVIYLRERNGTDVMLHVTKHAYLETSEDVLEPFRGHGDVYAVPG